MNENRAVVDRSMDAPSIIHRPSIITKGARTVTARVLLAIFDSVYLLALTGLVGSILFFSFGVAPILFGVLGPESGARFVRALFPRYYAWGVVCCAIALPAMVCGPLSFPELRGPMVGVQAGSIAACLVILLFCGNTLTPRINAARDEGPSSATRFDRLHRNSVRLNAVVLVIGIGLLVGFAIRKGPTTGGIEEVSPGNRASQGRSKPDRP
jgi:hypothetical protein